MKFIYLLLFSVLTACGHTQSVDLELSPKEQIKTENPKGKKAIAVLGCDKPIHLCSGMEEFDSDAFAIDLNSRQMKKLEDNPNTRPYGDDYPVATTAGCDNLAEWDQKNILSKRVVDSMHMMLKEKNTDCEWSKRFLQCGGALVVVGAYNNYKELKIAKAKEIYLGCQK